MSKPRIITKCVASQYEGPGEKIAEISHNGLGGLISVEDCNDGTLTVCLYRLDPGVRVVVSTDTVHNVLQEELGSVGGKMFMVEKRGKER